MSDDTYVHGPQPRQRISSARLFRGLDQAGLARAAGVNPSVVCRIESGSGYPSVVTLLKLAHALGVATDHLLGRSADTGIPDNPPRKVDPLERDIGRLSHAHRRIVAQLVESLGEVDRRTEKQEERIGWLEEARAAVRRPPSFSGSWMAG